MCPGAAGAPPPTVVAEVSKSTDLDTTGDALWRRPDFEAVSSSTFSGCGRTFRIVPLRIFSNLQPCQIARVTSQIGHPPTECAELLSGPVGRLWRLCPNQAPVRRRADVNSKSGGRRRHRIHQSHARGHARSATALAGSQKIKLLNLMLFDLNLILDHFQLY